MKTRKLVRLMPNPVEVSAALLEARGFPVVRRRSQCAALRAAGINVIGGDPHGYTAGPPRTVFVSAVMLDQRFGILWRMLSCRVLARLLKLEGVGVELHAWSRSEVSGKLVGYIIPLVAADYDGCLVGQGGGTAATNDAVDQLPADSLSAIPPARFHTEG
jgi:hypothetical protein